jgi:hypothetical protein
MRRHSLPHGLDSTQVVTVCRMRSHCLFTPIPRHKVAEGRKGVARSARSTLGLGLHANLGRRSQSS